MASNSGTTRVAVYGSLKKGLGNHRYLKNSKYLGMFALQGAYTMLNLKYYPGVVPVGGADNRILCEVYEVTEDTLTALDLLEGHPTYYKREKVLTPWKKAWMYFLPPEYLTSDRYAVVPDGVWPPSEEGMREEVAV